MNAVRTLRDREGEVRQKQIERSAQIGIVLIVLGNRFAGAALSGAKTNEIRARGRSQPTATGRMGGTSMKRFASVLVFCAGLLGVSGAAIAAGVDELPPDIQKPALQQGPARSAAADRAERLSRLEAEERAAVDDRLCELLRRQHLARRGDGQARERADSEVEGAWARQGSHRHAVQLEGRDADPADAAAGRSRRGRADHLLLEPDGDERDRQIRL